MPRLDPRLADIPQTANEAVKDRAIRHALYLERLKTQQARKVIAFMRDRLLPDVLDQIDSRLRRIKERGYDLGPETTERLQELAASLDQSIREFNRDLRSGLKSDLLETAQMEAEWQAGVLKQIPVELELVIPAVAQLRAVVNARPLSGRLLREWMAGFEAQQQQIIRSAVRQGVAQGETAQVIARRIRRGLGVDAGRSLEAIVRSAVTHTTNHARETVFAENADIIQAVQWVSTLDSRTCPICQSLDGKTFPINEGERPPIHIQCRCVTVGVLDAQVVSQRPANPTTERELVAEFTKANGLDPVTSRAKLPRGTKGKFDAFARTRKRELIGRVDSTVTYPEWLKRQSAAFQDEVLGPTRARAFRSGDVKISEFVADNRVLTIEKLKKKEPDIFS